MTSAVGLTNSASQIDSGLKDLHNGGTLLGEEFAPFPLLSPQDITQERLQMENPNINELTGTVSFSRKVAVRQYESAEASVFIQFSIPANLEGDFEAVRTQILSNARAAFFEAKGLVLEELGLEFQVDENGVLHELLAKNLGNVTEVRPTATQEYVPATTEGSTLTSGGPPYSADTQDKNQRAANKIWAMARWNSAPHEFWDNRENKRNPKGPDLKHKETGLAVWLS